MNLDAKKIVQFVFTLILTYVFTKFIKFYMKRKYYMKKLPGRALRFYKPFESTRDLLLNKYDVGRIGRNAWFLQLLIALNKLHRKEKLFCLWILHFPYVMLTKVEAVKAVINGTHMMDKASIYSFFHPWAGTGLLTSKAEKWKSRRKLLTPAFHLDILRDFMPVFNEQSQILVQRLMKDTDKDFIDISEPLLLCSLDIICETALGVRVNAQTNKESEYVKAINRLSELVMERIITWYLWFDFIYYSTKNGKQMIQDLKTTRDFTLSIIKEKKARLKYDGPSLVSGKKRTAFLDLLLEHNMQTDNSLTDEDVREEVDTITAAGHETNATTMTWTLYLIGLYKDVQEKLLYEIDSIFGNDRHRPATLEDLKHMKYLDCVLKESLRLYPSVPIIGRQVTTDLNICGYDIPEGSSCFIVPYIVHRDEDAFPNPEEFDPDRFLPENCKDRDPFAYIPFSAGPRNCIGQKFAMLEEKVVISRILRNFTLRSLDQREDVIPALNIVLRPSRPLRIQIRQRRNM